MVVGQALPDDEVADRLFRALADRTRRDLLLQAMAGTRSVSALADRYPMSTTAVQKHVAVLEEAGLLRRSRHGREVRVQTDIGTLALARQLLDDLEQRWRDRIGRIDDLLAGGAAGPGGER